MNKAERQARFNGAAYLIRQAMQDNPDITRIAVVVERTDSGEYVGVVRSNGDGAFIARVDITHEKGV